MVLSNLLFCNLQQIYSRKASLGIHRISYVHLNLSKVDLSFSTYLVENAMTILNLSSNLYLDTRYEVAT